MISFWNGHYRHRGKSPRPKSPETPPQHHSGCVSLIFSCGARPPCLTRSPTHTPARNVHPSTGPNSTGLAMASATERTASSWSWTRALPRQQPALPPLVGRPAFSTSPPRSSMARQGCGRGGSLARPWRAGIASAGVRPNVREGSYPSLGRGSPHFSRQPAIPLRRLHGQGEDVARRRHASFRGCLPIRLKLSPFPAARSFRIAAVPQQEASRPPGPVSSARGLVAV